MRHTNLAAIMIAAIGECSDICSQVDFSQARDGKSLFMDVANRFILIL